MAQRRGSVRMGPMSLLTLVIALCLAVMAVLSISTAKATYAATERQASGTEEVYQLESAGQQLLANADGILAGAGSQSAGVAALAADKDALGEHVASGSVNAAIYVGSELDSDEETLDGGTSVADAPKGADVFAVLTTQSGRQLALALRINDDATYQVLQWKTTKIWSEDTGNDVLWQSATAED